MATSVFIVHTNPVEGREDEFNSWYNQQHLADIVAIPGFASARRYEPSDAQPTYPHTEHYKYVALYEIDGEPKAALEAMTTAINNGMFISESMSQDLLATVYEPINTWVSEENGVGAGFSTDAMAE